MLTGISLLDPLGGLGQDVVSWFGHSISEGIGGFASWAINEVIHAMQSTTTPDFTSWFKGPWRASVDVAIVAGSVRISENGRIIRVHQIRHDHTKGADGSWSPGRMGMPHLDDPGFDDRGHLVGAGLGLGGLVHQTGDP